MNGEEKKKEKKEENSLLTSCFIKKHKTKPRDKSHNLQNGKGNKINRRGSFILSFKESIINNGDIRKVYVQVCYSTMSSKRRLFALKKTSWNLFDKVIFTEEYTVGTLEAELLFGRNFTQTGHRPYSLQIFITVVCLAIFWWHKIWFLFFL